MSETPTGTDRVELTDAEREALLFGFGIRFYENADHTRFSQGVAAVESIVAARVHSENQRLLAVMDREMDKLQTACSQRDAARAELAAANDRIAELTELFDGLRDDYQKACEEVERLQHHGWEDENADLQATLDRVTAVANEHWDWKAGRSLHDALRAALTPEGTE